MDYRRKRVEAEARLEKLRASVSPMLAQVYAPQIRQLRGDIAYYRHLEKEAIKVVKS